MNPIDWVVFLGFLTYVVWDGIRRGRGTKTLEGYFAGARSIPWWAAGLSIMATQASAITVIGTTGQGHDHGMEFVQTYFGLAFAMVLLSIFFVPMYRSQPILTAYEYLERRFGPGTRTLASLIFLVSRCLAFGVVLYTPGVVLSALLEIDVVSTVLFVGALTTIYTMLGGVRAVIATDVKQMVVIIGGLGLVLVILLVEVVPQFTFVGALEALGATGKLNAVEFTADPDKGFWNDKYNFWSGTLGGLFLMLAYFGADQSQVQRILTNSSADESRKALLLSAFAKVPMQAVVLFIGVLLYLFYILNPGPLLFDPEHRAAAQDPAIVTQFESIQARYAQVQRTRLEGARLIAREGFDNVPEDMVRDYQEAVAQASGYREEARRLVHLNKPEIQELSAEEKDDESTPSDTNYVFPHFILDHVPVVLLGLIMAAIFAAMMSSADSALNSLTSSSIVDIYRRWFNPDADEAHALLASRLTTVFWGVSATGAALLFQGTGSVIEVVNKVGSFFYGSLLGVFLLGLLMKRAGGRAGFLGMVGGMATVLLIHFKPFDLFSGINVEFLWYNPIGCLAVLAVGGVVTAIESLQRRV